MGIRTRSRGSEAKVCEFGREFEAVFAFSPSGENCSLQSYFTQKNQLFLARGFSLVVLRHRSTTSQIANRESTWNSSHLGAPEKVLRSYLGAGICEIAGKYSVSWLVNQVKFIIINYMAERGGFEPPVQLLTVQRFSKPPPSATRPSLRVSVRIIPEFAHTLLVVIWFVR